MATYTTNYHLKKPEDTDLFDIGDHNGNMDLLDSQLKQTETVLGQAADKVTLDALNGKVGTTTDKGGTATTGTVMGKLNALFGGGAIKSIQRGVVLFPSNADVRITISTINPQKTFVLLDNSVLAMGTQNGGFTYGSILGELASTSFVLKPNYGHISTSDRLDYTVGYQIVEFY